MGRGKPICTEKKMFTMQQRISIVLRLYTYSFAYCCRKFKTKKKNIINIYVCCLESASSSSVCPNFVKI